MCMDPVDSPRRSIWVVPMTAHLTALAGVPIVKDCNVTFDPRGVAVTRKPLSIEEQLFRNRA
jgi:hypothetical protein